MKDNSMRGKVILVTGSTDGIGKETAIELAKRGATVILHGRHLGRCQQALDDAVRGSGNTSLGCFAADLSSLQEVRKLADDIRGQYERLDVLINNAGVFMTDRRLNTDGFEITFTVNHLASFLLTHRLLDLLKVSAPSRIITVSSVAHQRAQLDFGNLQGEKRFTGYGAYALSKLANILFTVELAERLVGQRVTANCLHPGAVGTKLLRRGFGGMSGSSLQEGASTSVFLATSSDVDEVNGGYFIKSRKEQPSSIVYEAALRKKFWDLSCRLCGID
jgi:NAD(P)-dependent dehydrogenase (short-subunit alcohol dehydrogenase family)